MVKAIRRYSIKTIRRGKSKSVVFTRIFFSYLVILLIPFLIFSVLTLSITRNIKENSVRESEYVLDSVSDVMNYKMEMVYSDILNINNNIMFKEIINAEANERELLQLLPFRKEINYLEENGDVIYVYLPGEEFLVSSKGVYSKIEELYGTVFSYGDMDFQSFHSQILNGNYQNEYLPEAEVKVNSGKGSAILYLEKLPFGTKNAAGATVLFFINSDQIDRKIQTYVDNGNYWFGIYTKEGKRIYSTENCPEDMDQVVEECQDQDTRYFSARGGYDVRDCIYTMAKAEFNGWLFVSWVEKDNLYKTVRNIQTTIGILFLIYAVVGCYAAYYITKRNMKPVYKLLEMRHGEEGEESGGRINEFQMLEVYFRDVIDQNRQLTISNSGYLDKMKETWLHNLICGKYNTMEEIQEIQLSRIAQYRRYQVAIIDFSFSGLSMEDRTIDDFNVRRYMLKNLLSQFSFVHAAITEVNIYQFGILFYTDEEERVLENQTAAVGKHLREYLEKNMKGDIRIGWGESVEGALHIGYSFIQAECAVRACREYRENYMEYRNLPRQNERYYFPDKLREMLVEAVGDGNLKQANSILKVLNVENFETRKLSKGQEQQFLEEMYSVILHLRNKGLYPEGEEDMERDLEGQDRFFGYVQKILGICSRKTEQAFSQKKQAQQDLMEFIDQEYSNSSLCLSMAAERFQLSESYISYLFKKNYGVNFSAYVENRRIEQAKLLLLEGRYSVEEVGTMVGYNSSHVFRRAFRKVTGKNPSDMTKRL